MSRVLIVDDEPQYGFYLRDWLTREGYEVKTATTAEAAVDFGTNWLPTVLIADWMLRSPIDGLQVSQAVRAANPKLQTILITGYPSQELKARAAQANVFSFIEKPFSLTEVAGAVRLATKAGRPKLSGSVLVVSHSPTVGKLATDSLRLARYSTLLAGHADEAKRLLAAEPAVSIAILDCVAPNIDHGILAEELRGIRPDLIVIGSSEADDRRRFSELGIEHFLPRFWDCEDLHALLIDPLPPCSICGQELPLRFPLPSDEVQQWACSICDARFEGVLLADISEEMRQHVRLVS